MTDLTVERAVALIRERRSLHVTWDTASEAERARLARGEGVHGGVLIPASEQRAGLTGNVGFPLRIATAAMQRARCRRGALIPSWTACLDGYGLVCALDPSCEPSQGFKSTGARTIWLKKALRADHGADAALKAIAGALMDDWLRETPDRDASHETATTSAFFGGVLLALYERPNHAAARQFASLAAPAKTLAEPPTPSTESGEMDEALLAAIRANPDDDEPRLVLADWLTARGDPRGEFIQIQCKLKRALVGVAGRAAPPRDLDATTEELADREQALLARYGNQWAQRETPNLTSRVWQRGFVSAAVVRAANVGALAAIRTPLRAIKIDGLEAGDVEGVATARVPETLVSVDLSNNRIGQTRTRIFAAPAVAAARFLAVGGNAGFAYEKVMSAMLAGARQVTHLSLQMASLNDATMVVLARSEQFPKLEQLDIAYNPNLSLKALELLRHATSLVLLRVGSTERAAHERNLEGLEHLVEVAPATLTRLHVSACALPAALRAKLEGRFKLTGLFPNS
ncbi:MAG: TIGR02996 domain-containing protein [Polyangiaceae bacterium]